MNRTVWDRVDQSAGLFGCWPWQGAKITSGYGILRVPGQTAPVYAHRIAFLSSGGRLAPGELVMHSCDNPPCCNPAHLSAGTDKTNAVDKARKSRARGGLTVEQVHAIRRLHSEGVGSTEIARQLGLRNRDAARDVVAGKRYAWLA